MSLNEIVNTRVFPDPKGETMREGMTMRQWYKGMALQGLLASGDWNKPGVTVNQAAEIADAMVEEDKSAAQS